MFTRKIISLINGAVKETSDDGFIHSLRISDQSLEPHNVSTLAYIPITERMAYIEDRQKIMLVRRTDNNVFPYPPDHLGKIVLILALVNEESIILHKYSVTENKIHPPSDDMFYSENAKITEHEINLLHSWLENHPFDPHLHKNSCIGRIHA